MTFAWYKHLIGIVAMTVAVGCVSYLINRLVVWWLDNDLEDE